MDTQPPGLLPTLCSIGPVQTEIINLWKWWANTALHLGGELCFLLQTCSVVLADVVLNFCSGILVLRFCFWSAHIFNPFCSYHFQNFRRCFKVAAFLQFWCILLVFWDRLGSYFRQNSLQTEFEPYWDFSMATRPPFAFTDVCSVGCLAALLLLSTCFLKKIFKRSVLSLWYVYFHEVVLWEGSTFSENVTSQIVH